MSLKPHKATFSSYPLAALAASFAVGVLLAHWVAPRAAPLFSLAVLAVASALVTTLKRNHLLATWLVLAAFLCSGATLAALEEREARDATRLRQFYERGEIEPGEPVELTGVLERAPEIAPGGLSLSLRVESLRFKAEERACAGRVELFGPARDRRAGAEYDALELRRGARVRVLTALAREERFRNPGVSSLGEFLERRDLDARGTIKSPLLVERLDDERVFLPLALLDEWRTELTRQFDRTFSVDTAGVLKAAVVGNRFGLSREVAEAFREGGTFHVLVISGLHITFIGGLIWALMRRLTRRRAWQWAASVACVWTYAIGVGGEASVVRASLMFTLTALAPVVARRSNPLNAVGGAALALLVLAPRNLFDPSFQLTFLSVAAIVAIALPVLSTLRAVGAWRPVRETPYPPACPRWFQTLAEILYWSERGFRRELARSSHDYRLFKSPWAARLERWRVQTLLRFVFAAVVVSVIVQVVLLPLFVVYFHRVSLAAVALNVFVSALMVVNAFASFVALALAHLSAQLSAPFVRLTEFTAALMIHGVDPFERAHMASVRLPEYSGAASALYVLYFAPLLALTHALLNWRPLDAPRLREDDDRDDHDAVQVRSHARAKDDEEHRVKNRFVAAVQTRFVAAVQVHPRSLTRQRALKFAAFTLAFMIVIVLAHPLSAGHPDGRLRVDFLDVGQGDAALITMPDGATLLVDGGGRPDFRSARDGDEGADDFEPDARGIGDAVVSEYLWWRGLDSVNYVLATHADADHIDGLNAVVKNFRVNAALVARAPANDAEFVRFYDSARERNVPVYIVGRGDELRFGAVEIEVLWPPVAAPEANLPSGNNDSLVLRVQLGQRAFLLTGDAEGDAERALVAAGDGLSCDAIKVGHHGSRTSSTASFVRAARPALAVVSVGQDSPYGHPHAEVLERWRASGAQVLTTGQRGTITLSTDGYDLKVETFVRP